MFFCLLVTHYIAMLQCLMQNAIISIFHIIYGIILECSFYYSDHCGCAHISQSIGRTELPTKIPHSPQPVENELANNSFALTSYSIFRSFIKAEIFLILRSQIKSTNDLKTTLENWI